jgi:hypothetical protein
MLSAGEALGSLPWPARRGELHAGEAHERYGRLEHLDRHRLVDQNTHHATAATCLAKSVASSIASRSTDR